MIKCAYKNILESSAVSLAAGTEDSVYPLYRLYDRDIGRIFKTTAAETIEVKVDQGPTGNLAADRLLIPSGHNLDGMALDIKYSDNDADYYDATTQWGQPGTGLINKSWDSATHRYWKFIMTSPVAVPEMPELFLTQTYAWEKDPARPAGPLDEVFNVEASHTAGGADRFLVRGGPKRRRLFHMPRCGEAQKDNIKALFSDWGGSKPLWLCDHEGNWIYGRLKGPLNLKELAFQAYSFDFDFLEVLG